MNGTCYLFNLLKVYKSRFKGTISIIIYSFCRSIRTSLSEKNKFLRLEEPDNDIYEKLDLPGFLGL